MLRRSRVSVRPNVRLVGRTSNSQDALQSSQDALTDLKTSVDTSKVMAAEVKESNSNTLETVAVGKDGKSNPTLGGLNRRKRFSAMPNLAKPRATRTLSCLSPCLPRSPIKSHPKTNIEVPETQTLMDSKAQLAGLSLHRKRRLSGGGRQCKAQSNSVSSVTVATATIIAPVEKKVTENDSSSLEQVSQATDIDLVPALEVTQVEPIQSNPSSDNFKMSLGGESVTLLSEAAPLSLLETEKSVISGKSQSVMSERQKLFISIESPPCLAKTNCSIGVVNDPSDLKRLAKARTLRELLKQEMSKNKKLKKNKSHKKEGKKPKDHTKMTMRDLIYYLPNTNPMKSYLDEEQRQTDIMSLCSPVPKPPVVESPPELDEQLEVQEDEEETEEGGASVDSGQDDQLMVPRVKVAHDGSLIIDEESLTVEVLRIKGPNLAEENDPIFERGSTTTYSSFRKGTYTKPWSNRETDMFFLAISMVGTDFSLIGQLFPHRARTEIKNKFKKEERANSWRIDKAFREKRRLDLDFFSSLLDNILAQEEKERNKSKRSRNKRMRKPREKKAVDNSRNVEEQISEEDLDSDVVEGGKENEDIYNDSTVVVSSSNKKRKSTDVEDEFISLENPQHRMKTKMNNQICEEDEVCLHDDSQDRIPGDQVQVIRSESTDFSTEESKGPTITPAQLSRRHPPAVISNLGQKWGHRGPLPHLKPRDGVLVSEEVGRHNKVDVDSSNLDGGSNTRDAGQVVSSDDDEPDFKAVQEKMLNRPTRSGRIPKLSQLLKLAGEEDAKDLSPASPRTTSPSPRGSPAAFKGVARRVKVRLRPTLPQRKSRVGTTKSKLVTLRALEEDTEEVTLAEEDYSYTANLDDENQAFVPLGLRSQQHATVDVEETMEELDISINVPDALNLSQHALCPESWCEPVQGEACTVLCEHKLDLLVDVMDFLSPQNIEVSEESYNEAARTLLTIGNAAPASLTTGEVITEDFSNKNQQEEVVSLLPVVHSKSGANPPETLATDVCAPEVSDCGLDSVSKIVCILDSKNCDTLPMEVQPDMADPEGREEVDSSGEISQGMSQNIQQTQRNHFPSPDIDRITGTTCPHTSILPSSVSSKSVGITTPKKVKDITCSKEQALRGRVEVEELQKAFEAKGAEDIQEAASVTKSQAQVAMQGQTMHFPKPKLGRSVKPKLSQLTRKTAKPSPVVPVQADSTNETTPEEPVFILSLTPVPPLQIGKNLASASEAHVQAAPDPDIQRTHVMSPESRHDKVTHLVHNSNSKPVSEDGNTNINKEKLPPMAIIELTKDSPADSQGDRKPKERGEKQDSSPKRRKVQEGTKQATTQVKNNPTFRKYINQDVQTEGPIPITTLPVALALLSTAGIGSTTGERDTEEGAPPPKELDLPSQKEWEDDRDVHHITPVASGSPLTIQGRRPRGFLSFISNKCTPRLDKPVTGRSRKEKKCTMPAVTAALSKTRAFSRNNPLSCKSNPSTFQCSSMSKSCFPVSSRSQSESSCLEVSDKNEEPTNITEYFFQDIFTEVEEPE